MSGSMESLRVLELYSGIGGMHYALKESGIPAQVVAAIDINNTVNEIYSHNFPGTPLWNKIIEGISVGEFDRLAFDTILMSPPCQPFTRIGLQGDIADSRTKSFLYILDLLPRLKRRPRFILLENVKGFDTSHARECLVDTLTKCGYTLQEVLVSPQSFGIPNSRLRYYLMAKLQADNVPAQTGSKNSQCFPRVPETDMSEVSAVPRPPRPTCPQEEGDGVLYKRETTAEARRKTDQNSDSSVAQIRHFLEPEVKMEDYLLPPEMLLRYAMILDIVQPTCRRSICFTKGYGRYVKGTGSVLQCCRETEMESVFKVLDQCSEEEKLEQLRKLKLRYFTPREVASLMGFPQSFSFPKHISTRQRYKVLGNSLNVVVVARLLQQLLS